MISTPREPTITHQTLVSGRGWMSSWLKVGVKTCRGQPIRSDENNWQKTFAALNSLFCAFNTMNHVHIYVLKIVV